MRNVLSKDVSDIEKGRVYYDLGQELLQESLSESLECFYQSKQFAETNQDTSLIVDNLLGICDVHIILGEVRQALDFIAEAMVISNGNYALMADCHTAMSNCYAQLGEYDLSIQNDKQSLKYHTLLKDTLNIAYDYHNIGSYYLMVYELDTAISYYHLSNKCLSDDQDILWAYNHTRLGFAYTHKKDYLAAIDNHFEALKWYSKDSMLYEMALEENFIATVLFNNRELTKAGTHAAKALDYSLRLNHFELIKTTYNLLYDIYNEKEDYKNALRYSVLEHAYADSLEEENKESIINSIKIKHSFNEQKRMLESTRESNTELAKQGKMLAIFSVISLLLLVSCIIILLQRQKKHKKNKGLVLQLDRINQSSRKLLSIIGHDLRDSVGNLKNFTQLMHHQLLDNKSIETMVTKFVPMVDSTYGLLDTLLIWSQNNDEKFVPKLEPLNTRNIVDLSISHLSHLAKAKNIIIKQDLEESTFHADKNMMLTVMRNLISNSIKFSEANSTITIKSIVRGSSIEFSVKDEGVGMTPEQINKVLNQDENHHSEGTRGERGSGLGISLCNSFIAKHGGKLSVDSKMGCGSTFKFSVPKK
ncbi:MULTISPECIES: tetratricopeptide repeat-containing sensor histidine kinase [unclassified Saccharicrinis]|uniref:tetratricopeptide repeat-containing sensor histidine kinase n=1 Tax=unclassified Saccharicrinis TaxID=2646859 RepID=UPI003D34D94D